MRLPAVGTVRGDGSVRWWNGLTGAVGLLPVLRPGPLREAVALLWSASDAPPDASRADRPRPTSVPRT